MQSLLFQKMSQMGLQLGTESVGAYEATNSPCWLASGIRRPSGSERKMCEWIGDGV